MLCNATRRARHAVMMLACCCLAVQAVGCRWLACVFGGHCMRSPRSVVYCNSIDFSSVSLALLITRPVERTGKQSMSLRVRAHPTWHPHTEKECSREMVPFQPNSCNCANGCRLPAFEWNTRAAWLQLLCWHGTSRRPGCGVDLYSVRCCQAPLPWRNNNSMGQRVDESPPA